MIEKSTLYGKYDIIHNFAVFFLIASWSKDGNWAYVWSPKLAYEIGVRILAIRPKSCNTEEGS